MIMLTPTKQDIQLIPADESDVLQHTLAFLTIDLLDEINYLSNTDPLLAFQYGILYRTPWKDNAEAVKQFGRQQPGIIGKFVLEKAWCAINTLIAKAVNLQSACYGPVPVEPNIFNSLMQLLDDLNRGKQIREGLFLSDQFSRSAFRTYADEPLFNAQQLEMKQIALRDVAGQYPDIELADKVMRGIWDNYSARNEDLSTSSMRCGYGENRNQLADNRVYLCRCMLEKLYTWANAEIQASARSKSPLIGLWARMLSILYRSVCPTCMAPHSTDGMYQHLKRVVADGVFAKAVQTARKFSGVSPEAALCMTTDMLHFHGEYQNELPHRFIGGQINPDSLVERYLVLKQLDGNL